MVNHAILCYMIGTLTAQRDHKWNLIQNVLFYVVFDCGFYSTTGLLVPISFNRLTLNPLNYICLNFTHLKLCPASADLATTSSWWKLLTFETKHLQILFNPLSAGDAFKRIHTVFPQLKFDRN